MCKCTGAGATESRRSRRTRAAAAAVAFIGATGTAAHATDRYWAWGTPNSENWTDGSRWSPNGQPQAGDNAFVYATPSGNYQLNYDSTGNPSPNLNSLTLAPFNPGSVTFFQGPGHDLSAQNEILNPNNATNSIVVLTYNQTGGTNTVNDTLYVNYPNDANSGDVTYRLQGGSLVAGNEQINGTLNQSAGSTNSVSGAVSLGSLSANSGAIYFMNGSFSAQTLYVGQKGQGSLGQSRGDAAVDGDLRIGQEAGSNGSYQISSLNNPPPSPPSLSAGAEYVGVSGTGSFSQDSGGHTINGPLTIGAMAGGNGSFSLSDKAFLQTANVYVGEAGTGTFAQDVGFVGPGGISLISGTLVVGDQNGGVGTYTLGGGSLSVGGTIYVGNYPGSMGTFTISGGTMLAAFEQIGVYAAATFTQTGGNNNIVNALVISNHSGSSGTYDMQGGALNAPEIDLHPGGAFKWTGGTINFAAFNQTGGTVTATNEMIGDHSAATFTQTSGTNTASGIVVVGNVAGGQGTYTLGGNAKLSIGGTLYVGQYAGGNGNVNLNPGALPFIFPTLSAGYEQIGIYGAGTMTQAGGLNTIANQLVLANHPGSSGAYTLAGGTLSAAGLYSNGQFTQTGGAGTFGPITGTGTIDLGGGAGAALLTASSVSQLTVSIGPGGTLALTHNSSPSASAVNTLSIAGGGKLDLSNNSLLIHYTGASPAPAMRGYLTSGYDAGKWDGGGIIPTAADFSHAIGFADSSDGVVQGLGPDTLLLKYTVLGDADLDGKVGFSDLVTLARHYGQSNANWDQGDFNYDGKVGFDDLVTLARNYGRTLTAAQFGQFIPSFQGEIGSAFAQVPEPCALALVCAIGLLLRQRRCDRRGPKERPTALHPRSTLSRL